MINTRNNVAAGETLKISYSDVHLIDDLDAAAGTTVPLADETLLELGAAGHAALMRANDRVETINMNPDVLGAYRKAAADFLSRFAVLVTAEPGVKSALPDFPGDDPYKLVF